MLFSITILFAVIRFCRKQNVNKAFAYHIYNQNERKLQLLTCASATSTVFGNPFKDPESIERKICRVRKTRKVYARRIRKGALFFCSRKVIYRPAHASYQDRLPWSHAIMDRLQEPLCDLRFFE